MYNNQNYDPYAGQYPPPPPLQPEQSNHIPQFSVPLQQETFTQPDLSQPVLNDYYNNAYSGPSVHNTAYTPPIHNPSYTSPPINNPSYTSPIHSPPYGSPPVNNPSYAMPYKETDESSLDAYLRQEREEYFKNTSHQQPQNIPQNNVIYAPQNQDLEKAPMLQQQQPQAVAPPLPPPQPQAKPRPSEYKPFIAKPTLAPENEAESYKYRPPPQKDRDSCNCCCYNPAITCCSFFMLLISCAFCAGGIALIIASKVIASKCNSGCSDISDRVAGACNTVCNTVLQNGMFYGGIVIAGLAGIAIIWKLIMWTCAGYSKK